MRHFFPSLGCSGERRIILCSDKLRKSSNLLFTNLNYLQVIVECEEKSRFYLEMIHGVYLKNFKSNENGGEMGKVS